MRITPTISILSALVIILSAVWAPSASAATNSSKQTGVTKAQPKTHEKTKTAGRLKKVQFAKGDTLRASSAGYSNAATPGRMPVYNWSTSAT